MTVALIKIPKLQQYCRQQEFSAYFLSQMIQSFSKQLLICFIINVSNDVFHHFACSCKFSTKETFFGDETF